MNSEQPGTAVVLQPAHPCPFDEPTVGYANVGDVRAQQKVLANSTAGIQVLSTSVNNTTATAAISEYSQKTHISKYQFIIKISTIPNIVLIHHNICIYIYTYSTPQSVCVYTYIYILVMYLILPSYDCPFLAELAHLTPLLLQVLAGGYQWNIPLQGEGSKK